MYNFSAGGLYNGLVLLIDDETHTYWDHITGEAVHGPLSGAKMATWNIRITNVEAALQANPGLVLLRSRPGLFAGLISWAMKLPFVKGKFPPGFRKTMGERDDRLPEMEMGLGIIGDKVKRFYPMSRIKEGVDDDLDGHPVRVQINDVDGVPYALLPDGTRPAQLFTRWYGFSYTFPNCKIYGVSS